MFNRINHFKTGKNISKVISRSLFNYKDPFLLERQPNAIKANSLLKIKEKYMARQPSEFKKWWTSIAEAKLAIDELQAAIDKQVNDKDYHTKMHDSVLKLVDELGNNANFQKMITGIYTPAVFIGDNTNSHDELAKLLEEYDEKTDDLRGGNYNSKKTKRKRRNNKGITSKTNKTNKRK